MRSFTLGLTFNTNENEVLDLGGAQQLFTGLVSGEGQSNVNSLLAHARPGLPGLLRVRVHRRLRGRWQLQSSTTTRPATSMATGSLVRSSANSSVRRRLLVTTTASTSASPRPDFSYGIRFNATAGDFGIRAFFRGEQGRELFNNTALVYGNRAVAGSRNILDLGDEFYGDEAVGAAAVYSSRYIEDASFFRLDQLTVDYRLGSALPQVQNARVFVTANNLFVLTPYTGLDPEVNSDASSAGISSIGVDYLPYPRARTFTVGVNLGL